MTAPLGVILAGGRASRMGGGDKSLRPLAGRRVIDHVLERLRPQVAHMALSANGDPARFESLDLPVIADSMAEFPGPLAGVLAGMDWAAAPGRRAYPDRGGRHAVFPCGSSGTFGGCSGGGGGSDCFGGNARAG